MSGPQSFGSPGPELFDQQPPPGGNASGTALTPTAMGAGPVAVTVSPGETAAVAVAAQAKAAVESRYLMALQRPRNWLDVGLRLNAAMQRPGVAEEAEYAIERGGKKIAGPSIRFAEEALRAAGNILSEAIVVFDDDEKRIIRVTMTDLESNWSIPRDIVLYKTMERRSLWKGQEAISTRVGAAGQLLYKVATPEDELLMRANALISRVMRTDGLRLIPTDIKDDALAVAVETRSARRERDPDAAAKRLAAKFFQMGVGVDELVRYVGKPLTALVQVEADGLLRLLAAIRDGETTWDEAVTERHGSATKSAATGGVTGLRQKLGGKDAPASAAAKEHTE